MERVVTQSRHEIRAAQLAAGKNRRHGGGNGSGSPDGGTGFDDGTGDEGRTGWRKWVLGTLKWGSITGFALLVLGVLGVIIAYNKIGIPQPNDIANRQVSIVYYADGKTELDRIAVQDGNRES